MFENLYNALVSEIETKYTEDMEQINTPVKLAEYCTRRNLTYKKPENTLPRAFARSRDKKITEVVEQLKEVENAPDFAREFVITIEWKTSRTWGMNPRGYGSNGFTSGSIGGCGYDKHSAATAEVLNNNPSVLKLLYAKKDKAIGTHNHELLGYGSGYGILPQFESGVGISSHKFICESVGLKMVQVSNTKHTDVHVITKA